MKLQNLQLLISTILFIFLLAGCATQAPQTEIPVPVEPEFTPRDPPVTAPPEPDEPVLESIEFNSTSIGRAPPEDVLAEVSYYGGGGWGEPSCATNDLQIYRNDDVSTEPGCYIAINGCGFRPDELVSVTVVYPDGTQTKTEIQASTSSYPNEYPVVIVRHPLLVTDPIGKYSFTIEGNSGSIAKQVNVVKPKGARVYFYDTGLRLQGFAPMEYTRFFVYEMDGSGIARLVGWTEFQVDKQGD